MLAPCKRFSAGGEDRHSNVSYRTLVIGIGNELRADDAAGIFAARRIRELHLPDVAVVEHSGEGASLMELWKDQKSVIVLDAVQSGASPGTIHELDVHKETVPAELFHFSTHTIGLGEAIELSRALGQLPEKMIVFGVEGKNFDSGCEVSQAVVDAISMIADRF